MNEPPEIPCDICGALSSFVVNGTGYCLEHAEPGFRLEARVVANERGAPPDQIEDMAAGMLAVLLSDLQPDDVIDCDLGVMETIEGVIEDDD